MDRAASTKCAVLERMLSDESVEPTDLPLSLLEYITDGFSDDKQIGRGGFALVYKGILRNGTIAVKKLFNNLWDEDKFNQEVECLMKSKHKNVVRFLGYCADTQGKMESYNGKLVIAEVPQRLLCFEYLPKGSLHDYITDASCELAWTQYYQIIKGICAGLHYLHENCIVHLDLKPSNILFDDNVVPKIADFGLSRCFDERQSHVSISKLYGTLGYIAPEVYSGRITFKSDIYSLGVIITEILTGQKMYLEDYDVLESWGNKLDKLHREKQLEQLGVCAEIGKECTDYDPRRRPDARAIVHRLDEADIIVDRYIVARRLDKADIWPVWMLPPRQLRRQAASPGVRFRSPGAGIACLAGTPRRGRHPNSPIVTGMSKLSIAQEIHKVEEPGDGNQLFGAIGRELSLKCLLRLSRSDYGTVASLSRNFRSLVRNGDIYRLRQQTGVAEHWIYVSFNGGEWTAYDLNRERWIHVPNMPQNEYFMHYDKQPLAVGTNLLVFGRDFTRPILFIYSILTHSWIQKIDPTNYRRCLFGSTSVGQKAYLAGGTNYHDRVVSTAAAMIDFKEKVWDPLPRMNRARKLCSAAFMDGKLYVIGGVGSNREVLTCGEEYDFERRSWRVIDNMAEGLMINTQAAVPLVAVVNNELYAADYSERNVNRYDKQNNRWITLGKLPESVDSMNGWGIGFKACGDKLIAIGSSIYADGRTVIELYSWVPNGQPLAWNLIARHPSGSFLYDFAVMSC